MPRYVTDTHALVWYLSGASNLSALARSAFEEAAKGVNPILVPAIVIAELVMLAEKRKGSIDVSKIFNSLSQNPAFHLLALAPETALHIQTLTALPDIHDRLVVAEAIENQASLITRDQTIIASGLAPVTW